MLRPALLALFAVTALPASLLAQGRPAAVVVEAVERQTLAETVPVFGDVVASRQSDVAARVAGVVDDVQVLVGDVVAAGAVLAKLDTELVQIEYDLAVAARSEAEAGLLVADARLERTLDAFERIDGLRETAAFSTARLEDAAGLLAEARGQKAEAEARQLSATSALARAAYNLDRATITAPFEGVVLSVETDPGQFLPVGAPVARLLDVSALEVEATVPAQYVASLVPGLTLTGETEDALTLNLEVRAVLPTENAATRTRPVRFTAEFTGQGRPIAVGQSITVSVPVSQPREVLSVPKDALVQGARGWTVFVDAEGAAQPRTVEIGVAMGDRFEVLSGLMPGDLVVVRGNERLRPGQPLQATQAGTQSN